VAVADVCWLLRRINLLGLLDYWLFFLHCLRLVLQPDYFAVYEGDSLSFRLVVPQEVVDRVVSVEFGLWGVDCVAVRAEESVVVLKRLLKGSVELEEILALEVVAELSSHWELDDLVVGCSWMP
jgi:hypothetical protein